MCSHRHKVGAHPSVRVRGYGKADGLRAGFRFAKRVFDPPFGSTRNAPAGRPSGPQPFHTPGLRLENALRFPHPPLDKADGET